MRELLTLTSLTEVPRFLSKVFHPIRHGNSSKPRDSHIITSITLPENPKTRLISHKPEFSAFPLQSLEGTSLMAQSHPYSWANFTTGLLDSMQFLCLRKAFDEIYIQNAG